MATGRTNAKGAGGSPSPSFCTYSPPTDWIDIDTITAGNINLLVADVAPSICAFKCTATAGLYHVDWGDGTSADFTSGTVAEHTYTAGTGQACSRGYTTFKVVISPITGGALTSFAVNRHSATLNTQYPGILSAVIAADQLTSLANAFNKSTSPYIVCRLLEIVKFVGTFPFVTNATEVLKDCSSLIYADVTPLVNITNATAMFSGCYSLPAIDITPLVNILNASSMFKGCYALRSVDISKMTKVTTVAYMFNNSTAITHIDMRPLVNVVSIAGTFYGCQSLVSVDVSTLTKVTDAAASFSYCTNLAEVIATNFAKDAVSVTFNGAFNRCEILKHINFPNAKMKDLTADGQSAILSKLEQITMHPSSPLNGTVTSMYIRYNTLSAAQLDAIFTNLPTVTGRTIDITGCTGAVTCDRSIATAKGWTVTG